MSLTVAVRRVANWVNLSTPVGLAIARLGHATVIKAPDGIYWADGYRLSFPIAGAFTVGNVVITASDWDAMSDVVKAHELRHTWQWVVCGTLFLPGYAVAMGWSWAVTGDRAARNVYEQLAGLDDGGYRRAPLRPRLTTLLSTVASRRSDRSRGEQRTGGDDAQP